MVVPGYPATQPPHPSRRCTSFKSLRVSQLTRTRQPSPPTHISPVFPLVSSTSLSLPIAPYPIPIVALSIHFSRQHILPPGNITCGLQNLMFNSTAILLPYTSIHLRIPQSRIQKKIARSGGPRPASSASFSLALLNLPSHRLVSTQNQRQRKRHACNV
ncbi:hypothetical protein BJ165DRAFT_227501 [Panaeolus papilionaceus]|nr:hypothetical protein BJ165DRAFT_227501 [Panaeolus papilionaceus]